MEEKIIKVLRIQAWEKAKGELKAMLHTYYSEFDNRDVKSNFVVMSNEVRAFIDKVEYNGWHE